MIGFSAVGSESMNMRLCLSLLSIVYVVWVIVAQERSQLPKMYSPESVVGVPPIQMPIRDLPHYREHSTMWQAAKLSSARRFLGISSDQSIWRVACARNYEMPDDATLLQLKAFSEDKQIRERWCMSQWSCVPVWMIKGYRAAITKLPPALSKLALEVPSPVGQCTADRHVLLGLPAGSTEHYMNIVVDQLLRLQICRELRLPISTSDKLLRERAITLDTAIEIEWYEKKEPSKMLLELRELGLDHRAMGDACCDAYIGLTP